MKGAKINKGEYFPVYSIYNNNNCDNKNDGCKHITSIHDGSKSYMYVFPLLQWLCVLDLLIIASELESELSIICNVNEIESTLLVHSSLFLLSSSVDWSYRLYVFLWKREVTTQVMSVHGESEDHPGLYWYWSFVKSLAYRRPYAWKSLPQNAHAMSVKLIKLGHFLCAYVTS